MYFFDTLLKLLRLCICNAILIYNKAAWHKSGNSSFCFPDCWLELRMHPERPAIGQLDKSFLGLRPSEGKCWGIDVTSCYRTVLMQRPSHSHPEFQSITISFLKITPNNLSILCAFSINHPIKIPRPLLKATTSSHSNAFIFMLVLP